MSLELGKAYSRQAISELLGGPIQWYLPMKGDKTTCGCFDPAEKMNPNAPEEVLFGTSGESPIINEAADLVFRQGQQGEAIPVFIKINTNEWEYRGQYLCIGITRDQRVVQRKMAEFPERGEFHGVLRFERVG